MTLTLVYSMHLYLSLSSSLCRGLMTKKNLEASGSRRASSRLGRSAAPSMAAAHTPPAAHDRSPPCDA